MLIQRKLGEAYMGTLLCNYFKFKKKKKKKKLFPKEQECSVP